ncbi:hypothetical protein, partial [Escherichia coli]
SSGVLQTEKCQLISGLVNLTAVDRHSRRIRQKNRPHNNIILPQHVLPQIIITTETDYTNHASQIFVIFSYYYSDFTVVTFLFSKVLIADNSV